MISNRFEEQETGNDPPNDTTVTVADGARMRLFRNKGMELHIRLLALAEPEITAVTRIGDTASQAFGQP